MIKSRRRWARFAPLTKEECLKRKLQWSDKNPPKISVKGLSMKDVKLFTTKEQRKSLEYNLY
jgi:hypothetical protein